MKKSVSIAVAAIALSVFASVVDAQVITAEAYRKMTQESREYTMSVVRSSLLTGMISMAAANSDSAVVTVQNLGRSPVYSCLVNTPVRELTTIVSAFLLDASETQLQTELPELTVDALLDHCR